MCTVRLCIVHVGYTDSIQRVIPDPQNILMKIVLLLLGDQKGGGSAGRIWGRSPQGVRKQAKQRVKLKPGSRQ